MEIKIVSRLIKDYIIHVIKTAQTEVYSKPDRFGSPVEPEELIDWIRDIDTDFMINIFYPVLKR